MESFLPLVSILIPNYNKAYFLRETLNSILSQTYSAWECIIVDDHSKDNSWKILNEYRANDSRFRIFRRPYDLPKGGNACRNFAFQNARGKYVIWFDSDDLMKDFLLENRVIEMENNPKADFAVFSGCNFFKKIGDGNKVFSWVFHHVHLLESFLSLDPPWLTPSCIYKKSFLTDKELFWNFDLTILQDIIFDIKAYTKSGNIHFSKFPIDWYWRWHEDGQNVGSKRSEISALLSFNLVLYEFHKVASEVGKDLNEFISSAAYELCLSARDNYSQEFFKYIVWRLYEIKIFTFPIFIKHSMYFLFYKLTSLSNKKVNLKLKNRAMSSVLSNLNSKIYKERLKKCTDLSSFNQTLSLL